MKKDFKHLDQYRLKGSGTVYDTSDGQQWGAFRIPYKGNFLMCICAPPGDEQADMPQFEGWDHVSVHGSSIQKVGPNSDMEFEMNFTPSWEMMCFIKNLFFNNEDCVIQYHPARSDYVNQHPHTLHLWRPTKVAIPLPPQTLV